MDIRHYLLTPFSLAYQAVTDLRNAQYDSGRWRSAAFDLPVVSVGNLTVGGTGKTPMVEYLLRMLGDEYRMAVLSRGYGRKTKGYRLAGPEDTPATLGDEPLQIYRKFGSEVAVSVGEERAKAIPELLIDRPETQVVLLDDAFQHRKVRPGLSILLTDYARPFYEDYPFPLGRLREGRHGAMRADIVVMTKCPDHLSEAETQVLEARIHPYVRHDASIFFAGMRYGAPVPVLDRQNGRAFPDGSRAVLVTGVARSAPLREHVGERFSLVKHFDLPDHANYDRTALQKYASVAKQYACGLLVTEKDAVKWQPHADLLEGVPVFALPVETSFLEHGDIFEQRLRDYVEAHLPDSSVAVPDSSEAVEPPSVQSR